MFLKRLLLVKVLIIRVIVPLWLMFGTRRETAAKWIYNLAGLNEIGKGRWRRSSRGVFRVGTDGLTDAEPRVF